MEEEAPRPFGRDGTVTIKLQKRGSRPKGKVERIKPRHYALAHTDKPALIEKVQPLYAVMIRYIYRALVTNNWDRKKTSAQLEICPRTLRSYVYDMQQAGFPMKFRTGGTRTTYLSAESVEKRRLSSAKPRKPAP